MELCPYLFCLAFYLLYFFLPPFEDNGLLFWVPAVLCRHSEVVLWNLLSVQMFFWWICGGESGLPILFLRHLRTLLCSSIWSHPPLIKKKKKLEDHLFYLLINVNLFMNYFPCFYYWLMSQTKIALERCLSWRIIKLNLFSSHIFLSFHSFFWSNLIVWKQSVTLNEQNTRRTLFNI